MFLPLESRDISAWWRGIFFQFFFSFSPIPRSCYDCKIHIWEWWEEIKVIFWNEHDRTAYERYMYGVWRSVTTGNETHVDTTSTQIKVSRLSDGYGGRAETTFPTCMMTQLSTVERERRKKLSETFMMSRKGRKGNRKKSEQNKTNKSTEKHRRQEGEKTEKLKLLIELIDLSSGM